MTVNPETEMTLDEAVHEVLNLLTGLDLQYRPEQDRWRSIVSALNRALKANALEKEWSYYASTTVVGTAVRGQREVTLSPTLRPRMVNDDAVRLVDEDGNAHRWAYFLPRDAIHKYGSRQGLWVAVVRDRLEFSRPFTRSEDGLEIQVPVMREPELFRLPLQPEDPNEPPVTIPDEVRQQLVDFYYPDVIVARAAYMVAQSDPVMQPRVQTLEAGYKDLMYQVIERDDRNTDSPYLNEFFVPIQNDLAGPSYRHHHHPHSDERR